jgi:hypothetical protein
MEFFYPSNFNDPIAKQLTYQILNTENNLMSQVPLSEPLTFQQFIPRTLPL